MTKVIVVRKESLFVKKIIKVMGKDGTIVKTKVIMSK
jgi:hypothetical protein